MWAIAASTLYPTGPRAAQRRRLDISQPAASTALLAAGLKDWQKTARDMGVKQVMVIDDLGVVHLDPVLAKRIHFEVTPPPKVEISAAL